MTNHQGGALRPWLTLLRAPDVGPAAFRALLERFPDPATCLAEGPAAWSAAGLPETARAWLRAPDMARIDADLAWCEAPGHHCLTLHDSAYPLLLREIADPPPVLFVAGDPAVLAQPQLAVVGSRNPSTGGARTAHDFARHLAGAGLVITSGLATGIDGAAHAGALETGTTVAVLGTGPDRVYPPRHRELAHAIAAAGALVTEFGPGTPPLAENFPRRNRLIAGLSLGTLVVEAAVRSGSLITARHALEQGREVFAIPGSIHNPMARGCHALIRQGAKLVETAADIIEELGQLAAAGRPPAAADAPEAPPELDEDYQQLLDCMGFDPVGVDQIVTRSGLTAESVSSMLLILELRGQVAAGPGGRYTRIA